MVDSFFALLASAEEGPLLTAVMKRQPGDDAPRRAYMNWLLGKGDPRGELLRLVAELGAAQPSTQALAQRAHLLELIAAADPVWCAFIGVSSDEIFGCGAGPKSDPIVRFRFECPNKWETLTPTNDSEVRFCDECQQQVFRVTSVDQAEAMARKGRCIAVPSALTSATATKLTRHMVGRPDWRAKWGEAIFAGDSRSK